MKKNNDFKIYFWFIIFSLLFLPVSHSFIVNFQKLFSCFIANNAYNKLESQLSTENNKLISKLKYYESVQGLKTLVKDRLNKVEEGELIIRFKDKKDKN